MFWKDTHNIGCPWENNKVGIETRSRVFKCVSSWHLEQQGNTTGGSFIIKWTPKMASSSWIFGAKRLTKFLE